jgi:EAL domain-containing protein (putative c-di-GMP-specific phosphodiesterase class I)/CheY-like chemotaxis protein
MEDVVTPPNVRTSEVWSVPRQSACVLVADDDTTVLEGFCRVLERAGYRVLCAEDGHRAYEIATQQAVDAVVSDISMPGMNGVELIAALNVARVDVPVLLTTGAPSFETASRAVDHGAAAYLSKPVSVAGLRTAVERALGRRPRFGPEAPPNGRASAREPAVPTAAERSTFDRGLETLWVAFQPIYTSGGIGLYGYEALMRSDHPPVRNPVAFLDLAERIGEVWTLGRAMRNEAARLAATMGSDIHLFVNVSPAELTDPQLYDPDSPLSRIGRRVVLEITERASLDRVEDVPGRMATLRQLGFRIAVDDLGAGYSGLSALVALEPEIVKVDMSLVREVHTNARRRALIRYLIQASRDLGALVVAEGVEVPEERNALVELGCDLLQGYLLGRPERISP